MYEGEQTLLVTRPTRLISFGYYVLFVFMLVLAGALILDLDALVGVPEITVPVLGWSLDNLLALVFGLIGVLSLLIGELRRKSTRYIITDNKIVREDGILNKRTAMVPYSHLERVDVSQRLLERILRIGTVVVDTGDDSMSMDMVPRPKQVQELLSQRMGRRGYQGPK